jgi:hypothetical protein
MADNKNNLKMWQAAASATEECLPLEVLERMTESSSADPKAAAHLAECPHCQTELSMLKSFEASVPSADEGAAVAWIAAQLERKQNASSVQQKMVQQQKMAKPAAERISFWRAMFKLPYMAGAGALAAVLILAVSLYNGGNPNGPSLHNPTGPEIYRTDVVKLIAPIGEMAQAPAEFRWEAVKGAASYSIELTDVLGSVLASEKSTQTALPLTQAMKAQMSPGKPLKWKVTALDATGKEMAHSNAENFKVK